MAFLRQLGGFSDGTDGGESGIELTLGLSLNGRFGVDPTKIPRSSTVPAFPPVGLGGSQFPAAAVNNPLRVFSMPSPDYWKLKEVHTMNRLEARKRRWEKFISRPLGKGGDSDEVTSSQEAVAIGGDDDGVSTNYAPRSVRTKAGSSSSIKVANGDVHGHGVNTSDAPPRFVGILQAGSSSAIKASDGGSERLTQAPAQIRAPPAPAPAQKKIKNEPKPSRCRCKIPKPRADTAAAEKRAAETKKYMVEAPSPLIPKPRAAENVAAAAETKEKQESLIIKMKMPPVTTVGNGPNGRKIDGILYRPARGGGQVMIMCVCHGHFMSPAQFVQHAGGVAEGNGHKQIAVGFHNL